MGGLNRNQHARGAASLGTGTPTGAAEGVKAFIIEARLCVVAHLNTTPPRTNQDEATGSCCHGRKAWGSTAVAETPWPMVAGAARTRKKERLSVGETLSRHLGDIASSGRRQLNNAAATSWLRCKTITSARRDRTWPPIHGVVDVRIGSASVSTLF
jgi:hypothetical protein